MKHLTVIQHTQSDWLGHIEDHLEGRGIRFSYIRPFTTGGQIPNVAVVGEGLVLLGGGPWGSVADGRPLPTLDQEVRLARACLMLGKPVLGLGLGAQILALAAEGTTRAAPLTFHVGEARRIASGGLGVHLPASFPNVVYMRDRPVPPAYAEILAVDEAGEPALFQIGANAYGFTGHIGVRRAMVEDLVMEFEEGPQDPGPGLAALAAVGPKVEDALVSLMTGLITGMGLTFAP